jgi:hypothetical protein
MDSPNRGSGDSTLLQRSPGYTPRAAGLVPVSGVAHDANMKGTVSYWHLWTSCSASAGPTGKETRRPRLRGHPGSGIPGFGSRILANGIRQPPRRLQDTRPCRPPGRQDQRTHEPAGTASPRACLTCQQASARLTDETPPQASDLLRQTTHQGWRPNGTDCPETRTLRSTRQGLPGQDRQGSPRNRLRGKNAGRDVHTAPPGTVLLRESGAGRVGLNQKLRLTGMARRREIASKRKIMHLVRQGSRPRSG